MPARELRIPSVSDVMKLSCEFQRYEDFKLWYRIHWNTEVESTFSYASTVVEVNVFDFPIPVDDAGAGEFLPEMRAINLMRWIRKHIDFLRSCTQGDDDGA